MTFTFKKANGVTRAVSALVASAIAVAAFVQPAQAVTTSTPTKALVSTTWLKENLADKKLVLLHVGDADDSVYLRSHIEGAQFINWKTELANSSESKLKNGVVTKATFQASTKKLGINKDSTVVLYHEGKSITKATWGAWVFKLYGFADVRVLDGGLTKWTADGNAVSLAVPATKKAGNFVVKTASTKLRASIAEVVAAVKSTAKTKPVIVDNRDAAGFAGTSASTGLGTAPVAGHIASAKSIPTSAIQNADGTFKSVAEIKAAYAAVGVSSKTNVLLYCGTGLLASASWFALTQVLGYSAVKNYDGSWFEFSTIAPNDLVEAATK
jgi:thiosulfate/3-mercaptopyruvate sulfurtransferase